MKYLKLSGVLVALFFAVGCGSKSVDTDGQTTKTVVEQDSQSPQETYVDNQNGNRYPEGGFMGQGKDGDVDEYNTDNDVDNSNGMDESAVAGTVNTDDDNGDEIASMNNGDLSIDSLTTIYFDFDRYNIREDMKEYVRANADYIKSKDIKSVILQGNTDEFGGDEYNTALGLKRALSVRDALVLQGLPKNMFSTISYGMHKPVCTEKTNECYAKNRRTDLVEKQ